MPQLPFRLRSAGTIARLFAVFFAFALDAAASTPVDPLHDWSDWEKFRSTVTHPSGAFKPADLARARENVARHAWAQAYARTVERTARAAVAQLTPEYLVAMIPTTTPGDPKFTPCPACRAAGQPVHPHGLWSWNPARPDELTCDVCRTTFPHADHPESIVLRTTWRTPQEISFYGGEPFVIFGYRQGRPSFTANIRARKVSHLAGLARTLAEAHALSGKTEYAEAVRKILLRFAAVYPGWLVHVGYGEYADLDPRVAALTVDRLPAPELCPPPNRPDRKLHTGYWSAGRAGGVGQESHFVRRVVEAYDFTCTARRADGTPVYSDADRRTVERDLLLESTLLLVADKAINNKSVGNRTAAALVGLCVGHPGLVRFGWDGFQSTIDGWFLPDGTTSESPAYAMMTLGNVWDLPQALRGYAEPAGYLGPDGRRRAPANLYRGTAYERIWDNAVRGLQGDLTYPAFADSYRHTGLGAHFAELMVANYPERGDYLALLRELAGPDVSRGHAALALYYRDPALADRPVAPLVLPDWCPPELRIGHLRTGRDGRESLLLLSASHWGGHHHLDSLNLTYWKNGHEVLSDLGYLWDHPKKSRTARTFAHNTVLLDGQDQRTRERGGAVEFFRTSEHVKVMQASSSAYAAASTYRRTSAVIDHGDGRSYVVDFIRVAGGTTQDFVYHAAAPALEVGGATPQPAPAPIYDLHRVRTFDGSAVWRATWPAGPKQTAVAWNLGQPGETAFVGDGWGQRDWKNSDVGATLPYVVRRTAGAGEKLFASVFAAEPTGQPFVQDVRSVAPGVLAIATTLGTDFVRCAAAADATPAPAVPGLPAGAALVGRFAVVSTAAGAVRWQFAAPAGP
jgi:hypothetical protein